MLPAIAKGVAALPRIVPNENVTPEQAARVNAALERYDQQSRSTLHDCKAAVREEHEPIMDEPYSNNISVLMRGPKYLSILAQESYDDCGGPHPEDGRTSLVYDVTTGRRLDLLAVLPGSFRTETVDPADADYVVWPPLQQAAQKQAQDAAQKDTDPDDDCRPVYQGKDMAFTVWLNAEKGVIEAYPAGLSHFESATCGEQIDIDIATARNLGVSPDLLTQLTSAHLAAQHAAAAKAAMTPPVIAAK